MTSSNVARAQTDDSADQNLPGRPTLRRSLARLLQPVLASPHRILFGVLAAALVVLAGVQVFVTVRTNIWQGDFFQCIGAARRQPCFPAGCDLHCPRRGSDRVPCRADLREDAPADRMASGPDDGSARALADARPALSAGRDRRFRQSRSSHRRGHAHGLRGFGRLARGAGQCGSLLPISFAGILWSLSGPLLLPIGAAGVELPGYLVWAALLYAGLGSLTTFFMGRALVGLADERNRREGDFRFGMAGVRESAESIALLRGETSENERLTRSYGAIYAIARRVIRRTTLVSCIAGAYATAAPFVPILATAPQYLSGSITLGGMMQAAAAFMQVFMVEATAPGRAKPRN